MQCLAALRSKKVTEKLEADATGSGLSRGADVLWKPSVVELLLLRRIADDPFHALAVSGVGGTPRQPSEAHECPKKQTQTAQRWRHGSALLGSSARLDTVGAATVTDANGQNSKRPTARATPPAPAPAQPDNMRSASCAPAARIAAPVALHCREICAR